MLKRFTRNYRVNNSTRIPLPMRVPVPVPIPLPIPVKEPKKDFLIMEDWNTIIKPENYVQPENFLLTPEQNKAHWYAFLIQ